MENQIKESLKQGSIRTSQDLAYKLGKRKVKEIQKVLNY